MKKELPSDFRKKIVRLKNAHANLKAKNLEKSQKNKALKDRNVEIQENRDDWREKWKKQKAKTDELARQLEIAHEEREQARERAERESDRAEQLKRELEELREKKSRSGRINS